MSDLLKEYEGQDLVEDDMIFTFLYNNKFVSWC